MKHAKQESKKYKSPFDENPPASSVVFESMPDSSWDATVTLKNGFQHVIHMDDIPNRRALLGWVAHLAVLCAHGVDPESVGAFVVEVCERKGWKLLLPKPAF